MYTFDWNVLEENAAAYGWGAWLDLRVAAFALLLGGLIGLGLAVAQEFSLGWPRRIAAAYVTVVSSVPHYVLLLWIYFGIGSKFGSFITPIVAICISASLISCAYCCECFRSAIRTVPESQFHAGLALGFTRVGSFRHVLLPQVLRAALSPLVNIFAILLKGVTIMSVVSAVDMVAVAQEISVQQFKPFEAYTGVVIVLITAVLVISSVANLLHRRFNSNVRLSP